MDGLGVFSGIALSMVLAGVAHAITIDGQLNPEYGAALSTQTTQTSLGNESSGMLWGSELDEASGYIADGTLYLLFAGSFNRREAEFIIYPNQLQLYIDVGPGGQNTLSDANPSVGDWVNLQHMAGLTFDDDFAPDYWLQAARGTIDFQAYYAELPTGGGGAGYYLGSTSIPGTGTLSGAGAFNPYGILAAIDLSNTGGVTGGCDASSGADVTTGIELAVPLAAIGNPTGAIRICAMLVAPQPLQVSNQLLGTVPPGTCALGSPAAVDLGNVPGAQYFVIDEPTPVRASTWGRLKILYR
jgi:hypothetical protein